MALSSLLLASALLCGETPEPESLVLERLNAVRKSVGLAAVVADPELSKGCGLHARYLAKNWPSTEVLYINQEDPKRPGFSEDGRRAAKMTLPAVNLTDPAAAVDQWLGTLSSRCTLLDPDLKRIGIALERDLRKQWVVVVNVRSGKGFEKPFVYPPANRKDVPVAYSGPEAPDPIPEAKQKRGGYPVTVSFPPEVVVKKVGLVLKDEAGSALPAWLSTPEKPAAVGFGEDAACLIAKEVLKPGKKYTAVASAELDGQPWSETWSFTTRVGPAKKATDADMLQQVNEYRKAAGLPAVELDPALSKGCEAHAAYLVRNAGKADLAGLGVHDEKPDRPGFTKAGQRAARESVVAVGTAAGEDVDLWMGTFYHRLPFLDPDLKRIGFGAAGARASRSAVLDIAGRGLTVPLLYPVDKQTDVPTLYEAHEIPSPVPEGKQAGYPVTVMFPHGRFVDNASATLTDAAGKTVDIWLLPPDASDARSAKQPDLIGVFAKEELQPETTYIVTVKATVAGEAWSKTWSFTTAKK
jgi:uncharacterized protein YkwD